MTLVHWSLALAAGLLLLPHVLGPILVRSRQRMAVQPSVVPIDPEDGQIPSELWPYFTLTQRSLAPHGFREVGYAVVRGFGPDLVSWALMLERRESEEAAMAVGTATVAGGRTRIQARYVEFSRSDLQRRSVNVNNSAAPQVLPDLAEMELHQFPEIAHPARLLALHRALVARANLRPPFLYPAEGAGLWTLVAESAARQLARQVRNGYLEPDPARAREYRPTRWGALVMTWKLLWPWKWWRAWRRRVRNERLLAELQV